MNGRSNGGILAGAGDVSELEEAGVAVEVIEAFERATGGQRVWGCGRDCVVVVLAYRERLDGVGIGLRRCCV